MKIKSFLVSSIWLIPFHMSLFANAQTCTSSHDPNRMVILGDSHFTDSTKTGMVGHYFVANLGEVKARFQATNVDRFAVWGATACDWADTTRMGNNDGTVDHNFYSCGEQGEVDRPGMPVQVPVPSLNAILSSPPKVMIIQLGTNDVRRLCLPKNPDTGFGCTTKLVKAIHKSTRNCIWISPPGYKKLEGCSQGEYDRHVNDMLEAARNAGCQIVDIRSSCPAPKRGFHYSRSEQQAEAKAAGKCIADAVSRLVNNRADDQRSKGETETSI
ncbi:MAG: SGNH/GDSL hydrolase family protein [Bdellovibrionales bacterium]